MCSSDSEKVIRSSFQSILLVSRTAFILVFRFQAIEIEGSLGTVQIETPPSRR